MKQEKFYDIIFDCIKLLSTIHWYVLTAIDNWHKKNISLLVELFDREFLICFNWY